MKVIKVEPQIPELVERFQAVINSIRKYVTGRDAELGSLKVCLLTRHHLLLEGEPGLAKSRFALLAFRAFSGANVFQTMFHGQSSTDEILGPPNSKILRERGVLEFNTEGMLPTADFAYLDELFNGPGGVLNAALNVLNERKFANGGKMQLCPLKTAVATTNRVSDDPGMSALVDRFLIMRKVMPADSESARLKVLRAFLEAESVEKANLGTGLSLRELELLQQAVTRVKVPDLFLSMLETVRSQYVGTSHAYISDRRICWVYRAIQASILLETNGQFLTDAPIEALCVIADVLARKPADLSTLEVAVAQQFQTYKRALQEEGEISGIEKAIVADRIDKYDSSWPTSKKRKLYVRLTEAVNRLEALPPDQQFVSVSNQNRLGEVIAKSKECMLQIEKDLGLRTADGSPIDPDTVFSTNVS